jgi:hypothetical protein
MISTVNLGNIPDIEKLKNKSQSIALIYLILSSEKDHEPETSTYCFKSKENNKFVAIYNTGSRDFYNIYFDKVGAVIIGYGHYSEMSPWNYYENKFMGFKIWPGIIDNLPKEFSEHLKDFLVNTENNEEYYMITFCIWRKYTDKSWKIGNFNFPNGNIYDGSQEQLEVFEWTAEEYLEWANEAYGAWEGEDLEDAISRGHVIKGEELYLDSKIVDHIFKHKPITDKIIKKMNPILNLEILKDKITKIGYPVEE